MSFIKSQRLNLYDLLLCCCAHDSITDCRVRTIEILWGTFRFSVMLSVKDYLPSAVCATRIEVVH